MKIDTVVVGLLNTNCYILTKNNSVLVIDPGDDIEKINSVIGDNVVVGVLITHSHYDHVGALSYFNKDIIYDFSNLKDGINKIGDFVFEVISTPGHSDDSISFYFKELNSLFCGDFIFYESIGRCDLPSGNFIKMRDSINKIKKCSGDIKVYPGHGISTSLEYEKKNNIYFNEA